MIFGAVVIRPSTPLDGKRHVLENTNLVIGGRLDPIDAVEAAPRPGPHPRSASTSRVPEQFL